MTPLVSVIVPTRNRLKSLRRCLDALAHQRLPRTDFEVIVVDDGGTERIEEVTSSFQDRMSVVLQRQTRSGPGQARNFGAIHARGRWLAFTDDDCEPDSE